jgi:hypothetical protein
MLPKPTGLLHDAHKNQARMLRLLQKIIKPRVGCFEAKSATEKFDLTLTDTAQSEIFVKMQNTI